MTANFHNVSLLYRYLRMLSVQVDVGTVARLLAHPMGSSMRGLSDALDALSVRNAVYQLPPEYFDQLEAPFIAVTRQAEAPFCLIERINGTLLTVYTRGKRVQMEREAFLRTWTGGVLMGEVTAETQQDRYFRLRNVAYWIYRYSLLEAGILGTLLVVIGTSSSVAGLLYLFTLCAGIFVSSAILYKEMSNRDFLHRFCHIGTAIDCNTVLQSKGARMAGMGLGELSLFYFSTLLLFSLGCPEGFLPLAAVCALAALAFTVYSVVYQLFVIKKGCMLCLMVCLTVWLNSLALYLLWNDEVRFMPAFADCVALALSAAFCMAVWQTVKRQIRIGQEAVKGRQRLSSLFNAEAFKALSGIQPHIGKMPDRGICLHNGRTGDDEVLIVTNPMCKNCARVHPYLKDLSARASVSLILLTFPGDKVGREVALRLIAAWQMEGWGKMIELLEMWNEKHDLGELLRYPITEKAEQMYEEHLSYAIGQHITQTPSVIIQGAYMPEVYRIEDLKYVWT